MRKLLLLASIAFPALCAITNLRQVGATSTSILISYTKYSSAAVCTIEASKAANFSPLAVDVDTSLFTGAASDTRYGNIAIGREVTARIGKHGAAAIEKALDGYTRSRALEVATTYYVRVSGCGDGDSQTITASTANIPWGITRGDAIPADPTTPWKYLRVSQNQIRVPEYNDPFTGTRIVRTPAMRGFAYGATSDTNEALSISGCNISVAGSPAIKGSCRFVEAVGTNWSATSGTTTDAILANDDNYLEYSGTAQDKLFIRYGVGRFPDSGSYGAIMASMNAAFVAKTSDATGEGGYLQTCITRRGLTDKTCSSPPRRVTLTTSKANYIVCDDSPCTTPDNPGDTMEDVGEGTIFGKARVWNQSGSYTTLRFVGSQAATACNELSVGQRMTFDLAQTNLNNPLRTTVSAKDCGASPPQVTVADSFDLSWNTTGGVPYWVHEDNYEFGILVWKESTTSNSTIQIDLPLLRTTFTTDIRLAAGAGGFGRTCQGVPTASGHYLCMTGYEGNVIIGLKTLPDGSLDIKNYGLAKWRGSQLNGNLQDAGDISPFQSVANYPMWSDTAPGVFYMKYQWNGGVANGKEVLVRVTMALTERTVSNMDDDLDPIFGSNRAPKVAVSEARIITPCLNSCSVAGDDQTWTTQRNAIGGTAWTNVNGDFPVCSLQAMQGNMIYESCINGGQDTYGWMFVADVGNESAIGSGFVGTYGNTIQAFAASALHETPSCRFCALHTVQSPAWPGGSPALIREATNKCQLSVTGSALSACNSHPTSGTCSACPAGTVIDGYDYSGKPMCSQITLSSSWNSSWIFDGVVDADGPPTFESGDPVDANCGEAPNLYWLGKLQVGDFLSHIQSGVEYIRMARRDSNQSWWVIRGWGAVRDPSTYQAKAHNEGSSWSTKCGSILKDPLTSAPLHGYAEMWYPALSNDGSNPLYSFLNPYQNHGVNGVGWGVKVEDRFLIGRFDADDPTEAATHSGIYFPIGNSFSSKSSFCWGNACETHPSMGQVAATGVNKEYFVDVHPRLFTGTGLNTEAPLVAGKTYIRRYAGNLSLNPKHYDIELFSSFYPFRRSDTLSDAGTESGKKCTAIVDNDCFTGSSAGETYFVNESADPYFTSGARPSCKNTQFYGYVADFCAANTSPNSGSVAQYRLPPPNWTGGSILNGQYARVIAKDGRTYREAATENNKTAPDGKTSLGRGFFYYVLPPLTQPDSVNRGIFQAVTQTRTAPAGTSTAIVRFGYDPEFRCSVNRDNTCISQSAAIDKDNPYLFDHETVTGISCSSSCTITIPALSNRVLYSRWEFRDAGGNVIHADPITLRGVN